MIEAVTDEKLDPNRWRALAVCLSALTLTTLDVSIIAVALPSISRSIHAGPAELQWVVSGYALGFGMVPVIAGRLGDDYGRRLMLMIGIGAFCVTSAIVGCAPVPAVLIGGRVAQGLAGGLINPQVSGLIQRLFPGRERAKAFALLGMCVGGGTATGPVLGGLLLSLGGSDLGWRLAFLINVPVSITALCLCVRWLPASAGNHVPRSLDLIGAALLALAVFATLFPIVEYDSDHDLWLLLILVPSAGLFAAFVAWERGPSKRRGYPLINIGLFSIRSYANGFLLALLFTGAGNSTPIILSLFLQEGLGVSPLRSGLVASAAAVGVGVGSIVAGRRLARKRGSRPHYALVLFIVGNLALAVIASALAPRSSSLVLSLAIVVPLLILGLGNGGVMTTNQTAVLADVDVRGGSTAGGMFQSAQRLSTAVETAVVAALFYSVVAYTGRSGADPHRAGYGYGYAYAASVVLIALLGLASLLAAVKAANRPAVVAPH